MARANEVGSALLGVCMGEKKSGWNGERKTGNQGGKKIVVLTC